MAVGLLLGGPIEARAQSCIRGHDISGAVTFVGRSLYCEQHPQACFGLAQYVGFTDQPMSTWTGTTYGNKLYPGGVFSSSDRSSNGGGPGPYTFTGGTNAPGYVTDIASGSGQSVTTYCNGDFFGFYSTGQGHVVYKPTGTPDPTPRCELDGKTASPNVHRPVNAITGNVWFDQTDVTVYGVSGLTFTRSYNSSAANATRIGAFGNGWSHAYESHLEFTWTTVGLLVLWKANGDALIFSDGGNGSWVAALPRTERSTIQTQGDGTFIRSFRAGGSEKYDAQGKLTRITDLSGNMTNLTYLAGKLSTIVDPGGRTLTLGYTGAVITSLSGPSGLIANYTYLSPNRLNSVRYPDGTGGFTGYVFDFYPDNSGTGSLIATVKEASWNPSGTQTVERTVETHTYNTTASGAPGLTSEISGGKEKYTLVFPAGFPMETRVTDALGNLTTYYWSAFAGVKKVFKIVGPCTSCGGGGSQTQEWTYDIDGRVSSYKDGLGHKTSYTYLNGDLQSETDPLLHTTNYTYDPQGRVLTVSRPDGGLTTTTYVAAGPSSITEKVTATANRTTNFTYRTTSPIGKLATVTDPRGKMSTLAYNAAGDLTSITDPLLHATSFGYDALGRRTSVTDPAPLSHTTWTTYDTRGRVTQIKNHDLTHTDFTYDTGGRRATVTDPLLHGTTYGYDPYGRLHTVTDQLTGVTTYDYDSMSHLTSLTDARGKITNFEYFPGGQVKKVIPPPRPDGSGAFESFTYDNAGRLITRTDRKNVVTTFAYDDANRLTGKTYSDTTPAVSYTYDFVGRVLTAANGTDALTWTYDLVGQTLTEASVKNASNVAYTYDPGGNRLTLRLDGSLYLSYVYDNDGRLTTITRGSSVFGFGYDNAHRRTSLTHPNGVSTSYGYDNLNRLTSLSATKSGSTITSSAYTYDNASNRLTKTMPSYAETYTYDGLNRLMTAVRGATTTESYTYDAVGNRLSSLGVPSWTYDDRNELGNASGGAFYHELGFDGNGNLHSDYSTTLFGTYEWNAENELTKTIPHTGNPPTATYLYDPLGRRVEKTVNGVSTKYTYDGEDILRTTTANRIIKYLHGPGIDEPLAVDDGTALVGYHADGLGSIVKATDPWGAVIGSLNYDALGNLGSGPAAVSVTPSALGFGTVAVGTSSDRYVTLRNVGGPGAGFYQSMPSVTGSGFSLPESADAWPDSGQAKTVKVRFTPGSAGASTGTLTLTPFGAGTPITVPLTGLGAAAGGPTATASLDSGYPFQTVTVSIANGPGSPTDWVGLYAWDAANNAPGFTWWYLNGTRTQPTTGLTSATLTFSLPAAVGTYEFRFFANNGYTVLAKSTTFAVQTTLPPGPYAYTGREWDQETGLYYYRARYYDPKIGRFLNEDPIGLDGGDVNFYAYVFNNPTTWIDPTGLAAASPAPSPKPTPAACPPGFTQKPQSRASVCCSQRQKVPCIEDNMPHDNQWACLVQHEETHIDMSGSRSCPGDNACEPIALQNPDECFPHQVQYQCLQEMNEACDWVKKRAETLGCDTSGPRWKPRPPAPSPRPRRRRP